MKKLLLCVHLARVNNFATRSKAIERYFFFFIASPFDRYGHKKHSRNSHQLFFEVYHFFFGHWWSIDQKGMSSQDLKQKNLNRQNSKIFEFRKTLFYVGKTVVRLVWSCTNYSARMDGQESSISRHSFKLEPWIDLTSSLYIRWIQSGSTNLSVNVYSTDI